MLFRFVASQSCRRFSKRCVDKLGDAELRGKHVFVRTDFNVPIDKKTGEISDDTRIRAALPTIEHLRSHGARVVIGTHFGRPKHGYQDEFRLIPVERRLSELLGHEVRRTDDCIGPEVEQTVAAAADGDVILLENVRFHAGETKNDSVFSKALAEATHASVYVNDAFGTAHRAHCSTEGITKFINGPHVAGFLLDKEIRFLAGAVSSPKRPFAAVVGGSKVSTKISVLESLMDKVDTLVIGGGMLFTFLKARGLNVGASMVEDDSLQLATRIEELAKQKGVELYLPVDVVVADRFAEDANFETVSVDQIPEGFMGLDIGQRSIDDINNLLDPCKTVVWNGPMGVFEWAPFANGTLSLANTLAALTARGCITIVGGGDSVAAVEQQGRAQDMSHISTGGGACLEMLEGKLLPGVAALDDETA